MSYSINNNNHNNNNNDDNNYNNNNNNNNNNNSSSASSPSLNFGVVVPGRLPVTGDDFRQVSDNRWMAPIGFVSDAFTVFLLSNNNPLPERRGLACYLCRCEDNTSWTYIGHLTNDRPSALLRAPTTFLEAHNGVEVFLGVSLQSLGDIQNFANDNEIEMQKQARAAQLDRIAAKVAEDFYNFVGSFARTEERRASEDCDDDCHGQECRTEEVVVLPLSWVNKWRSYITHRIQKDPVMFNGGV